MRWWWAKKEQPNATAAKLIKLLKKCPVCRNPLVNHRYAELANTSVSGSDDEKFHLFMTHFRNREWEQLLKIQSWRGDTDDLVCYAISGPHTESAVLVEYAPFELYADEELLELEVISSNELSLVTKMLPLKWENM